LFQYPADVSDDNGDVHVEIVAHQNHVIFLHKNYPPLKWNGDEPVNWLGVRETPQTPEIHAAGAQIVRDSYWDTAIAWGASFLSGNYYPPAYLQDVSSPTGNSTIYKWKIAFQNSRGEIGRWSSPVRAIINPTDGSDNDRFWIIVEWRRPEGVGPTEVGSDITHVWVARTGDLRPDPDADAYFLQGIYPYTQNRITDNNAGLSLAIEEDIVPPPMCGIGCVFKDTLFLSGNDEDPYGVWYSKAGRMEAFAASNYYKATDVVTAVLALSDRVVVITKSTIEVLVLDSTSSLYGLFRKEVGRGATVGRSLAVYKDNIFGVFNSGFGIFDGFQFKGISDEYDELFEWVDKHNADRVRSFVDHNGSGYWCIVNHRSETAQGDTMLLHFDFNNGAWFRVIDTNIMCMWEEDEQLYVGGYEDLYQFDMGNGLPAAGAVFETVRTGFEEGDPRAALSHKTLNGLYFYLGSTSNTSINCDFYVDENLVDAHESCTVVPRANPLQLSDAELDAAWDSGVNWDSEDEKWKAPKRFWGKAHDFTGEIRFYSLRVALTMPSGGYYEIAGLGYDIEVDLIQSGVP